jgi:uncharacterized protein (TIGR02466 family)
MFRMDEVFGIFPTPLMRAQKVFGASLLQGLVEHFSTQALHDNNTSPRLSHTLMLHPSQSPLFVEAANLLTPKLVEFGTHLFGERIGWALKEMWVNVLDPGGHQAMHNHANSFISGVVYLTTTHAQSCTTFLRNPGGSDFKFKNDHQGATQGPYNADRFVGPEPEPGDVLLFPSYLLHAVPPNQGERRITLAFNAIPTRLDSWGYVVQFSG